MIGRGCASFVEIYGKTRSLAIHVPENLYENFQEMPPLFVVEKIPEPMKAYREQTVRKKVPGIKKLLGSMKATKILLFTPMLKWYLANGLKVTAVHHLIEYESESGRPFGRFPKEAANTRRDADKDKSKQILGNTAKLKENSFYRKMIENKTMHTNKFTNDENGVDKALRSAFFAYLEEIGRVHEISEHKRSVNI